MPLRLQTGRSRGFGFIKMGATEEATACIEKLNGIVSIGCTAYDLARTERAV